METLFITAGSVSKNSLLPKSRYLPLYKQPNLLLINSGSVNVVEEVADCERGRDGDAPSGQINFKSGLVSVPGLSLPAAASEVTVPSFPHLANGPKEVKNWIKSDGGRGARAEERRGWRTTMRHRLLYSDSRR